MTALSEKAIWDAYNFLLMGPDIERLRKLLVRADLLRRFLNIPGDVVECGVFKGAGLLHWLKMLEIYAPGSAKRVIGFDFFDKFDVAQDSDDATVVEDFVKETGFRGITCDEILDCVRAAGIGESRCELVRGDIASTAPAYVQANPGFRIALLHLDLDLEAPTYAALEAFWPRITRGGGIVFDEYAIPRWSESEAVDRFFQDKKIALRSVPHARTPTAFLIKE